MIIITRNLEKFETLFMRWLILAIGGYKPALSIEMQCKLPTLKRKL